MPGITLLRMPEHFKGHITERVINFASENQEYLLAKLASGAHFIYY